MQTCYVDDNDQAPGRAERRNRLDISHKSAIFTLQEEQSLCVLQALGNIHLGQPQITFPSPFRVAGVGRSIITLY